LTAENACFKKISHLRLSLEPYRVQDVQRAAPSAVYAVLTGDLIGSTKLAPDGLAAARTAMTTTLTRFRAGWSDALIGEIEFFRGDSWQILLARPELALRLALLIRAALRAERTGRSKGVSGRKRAPDTRLAICIGFADQIVPEKISVSNGEVFVLSGRALDQETVHFAMTASLPDRAKPVSDWLAAVTHLCDSIVSRWTARQAELMRVRLLSNLTQQAIATGLRRRVAKQSVQGSLASAGWRPLMEAVDLFERTDWRELTGGLAPCHARRGPSS
jgi:hypothetical protein